MVSILPQDSPDNPSRAAALAYSALGWPVLPLHTPDAAGQCSCRKKDCDIGKHPRWHPTLIPNGHTNATTDPTQIEACWNEWPDANIGICTGEASGIAALDVDPRNGGDVMLDILEQEHGKLPETLMAFTGGGGQHYYFKLPPFTVKGGPDALGRGLDVKVDGYIVAPPSLHASGRRYEYEATMTPGATRIAEMPPWMSELLRAEIDANNGDENIVERQNQIVTTDKIKITHASIYTSPWAASGNGDRRPPEASQGWLAKLYGDTDVQHVLLAHLGIPKRALDRLGSKFHCRMHLERNPSASLKRAHNGSLTYIDWHKGGAHPSYTLAEVYAVRMTDRDEKLTKSSHATWAIRLLVDTGVIAPHPVTLPPLPLDIPAGMSKVVKGVYEGFRLLLACKWLYHPGEPTAFSHTFAEGWCGTPRGWTGRAIQWLWGRHIITMVAQKPFATFLPGSGSIQN